MLSFFDIMSSSVKSPLAKESDADKHYIISSPLLLPALSIGC